MAIVVTTVDDGSSALQKYRNTLFGATLADAGKTATVDSQGNLILKASSNSGGGGIGTSEVVMSTLQANSAYSITKDLTVVTASSEDGILLLPNPSGDEVNKPKECYVSNFSPARIRVWSLIGIFSPETKWGVWNGDRFPVETNEFIQFVWAPGIGWTVGSRSSSVTASASVLRMRANDPFNPPTYRDARVVLVDEPNTEYGPQYSCVYLMKSPLRNQQQTVVNRTVYPLTVRCNPGNRMEVVRASGGGFTIQQDYGGGLVLSPWEGVDFTFVPVINASYDVWTMVRRFYTYWSGGPNPPTPSVQVTSLNEGDVDGGKPSSNFNGLFTMNGGRPGSTYDLDDTINFGGVQ